jgi:hypothetical protein
MIDKFVGGVLHAKFNCGGAHTMKMGIVIGRLMGLLM